VGGKPENMFGFDKAICDRGHEIDVSDLKDMKSKMQKVKKDCMDNPEHRGAEAINITFRASAS